MVHGITRQVKRVQEVPVIVPECCILLHCTWDEVLSQTQEPEIVVRQELSWALCCI